MLSVNDMSAPVGHFVSLFTHLLSLLSFMGVVGGGKGVVYLMSPGLQMRLGYNWARFAILAAYKGRGGMFLFLLFLHFHSFSSFSHVPLFD